jgi:hypothetical protein
MTEEKKISREDMRLSWTDGHENILKQWGEASACYRYMHHRAFFLYKRSSIQFTLPVIILSTLTGTANFAQGTFPENVQSFAPAIIGGLNLAAGLIATISQFLKINELMENHRTAALAFGMLSRNIRLMLALDRGERSKEGLDFVGECKTEYDRLLEQSPSVPKSILVDFENEYPLDNAFTKPEILDVRSIPLLALPKTIDPVEAVTVGTPFEKIGKFLSKKDEPPPRGFFGPSLGDEEEEEEEEEDEESISVEAEEETDVEQGRTE